MPNDHCDIRAFFAALVSGNHAARGIPAKLTRLAEYVLRYDGLTRATADDLVAELLRRLLENDMRLLRNDLARFTEADLERVLRFRLRQIALEDRPRWPLVRALRGQVRAVLAAGLPGPGALPASLEQHFRLEPGAVAKAAAHFVAQGTPATVDVSPRSCCTITSGPSRRSTEFARPHRRRRVQTNWSSVTSTAALLPPKCGAISTSASATCWR